MSAEINIPLEVQITDDVLYPDVLDDTSSMPGRIDTTESRTDKEAAKREARLMKTANHIAKKALHGENGFGENHFYLAKNQRKTPGDWRNIQERLASDGIMVEFEYLTDDPEKATFSDDYSHRVVRVLSLPEDYSPKHSRKYTGKHRS